MNAVVVAAFASSVGRVRDSNEDACLVDEAHQIFMVADGMGGHAAGEVASHSAISRVFEAWASDSMTRHRQAYAEKGGVDPRRSLLRAVRDGVNAAHLDLVTQSERDPQKHGMGTTFIGFLVAGGEAAFAHAGDSRAYLIRDGMAMQLSEDHTVISQLKSLGAGPDGEQFGGDGLEMWRGQLTNALGTGEGTRVATFVIPLYTGDRIVLCSDGVYEYMNQQEIAKCICSLPSPARAANALVEMAVDRGGHDNATAVVVKIVEGGETKIPPEQRNRDDAAIATSLLFGRLTLPERLRALRIATYREIKAGKSVPGIALGCRVAYLLLEGQVATPPGELLGPGAIIYPSALVVNTVWGEADGCETRTPVRLLTIRCDDFFELCDEELDLGIELFQAVAEMVGRP